MDFLLGSLKALWSHELVKKWLRDRLNHLVYYERRVKKLEEVVDELVEHRVRVQRKVDEEEIRRGREIDVAVKEWLAGVDLIISEYEKFKDDGDRENAGCFEGFLVNPVSRYSLSERADDITGKVNGLLQKASYEDISHWRGPPSMGFAFSNDEYETFASRDEAMKKIRTALEDSSVRMIGVHGLTGVGKTTLVKEVAKKAREDKLFNAVIMANITRNPDIRKIQGQIADMLGMKLEEESESARAARIRERLKNEKENTLIILDDLFAKVDFNMLGIPSENDDVSQIKLKTLPDADKEKTPGATEPEDSPDASNMTKSKMPSDASNKLKTEEPVSRYKGCKILLISESRQVLRQMNVKEDSIFSVEVLREKEAEKLFKKMAGVGDKDSTLAAQIANKCKGLPISIVTTAGALKNQSQSVWEDVHRKLERQKLTGAPDSCIELSYELLENEELKYTFLLSARMGHDILIMDFVKYCIGLGFLEGIDTVREARDRVQALLVKLKESSLLSDSYSSDRFTMQDIVRDAALSIASKEKHVFMMTNGKLDEWPDEYKFKRYTAISLQQCDIIDKFPESINCSRLRVFYVDSKDPHLKIPDNFYKGMKELRVLILIGIHLSSLPPFKCLTKLRMLCLERCLIGNDQELSIIGELKNLRILSLSGSDFLKLPVNLKQLTKLQIFDISNCSKLGVIPANVISSLTSLEELYVRNNLIQWKVEGSEDPSENASLSELRHLNQLTNLDIKIPNVAHLPKNLFFDKLYSYKIIIGDMNTYLERDFKMPEKYEAPRFLAIQGFDIHSQKGIKMLLERVENLLLGELNGVQDIFYELNWHGFPYLKQLNIVSNSDIKYIIDETKCRLPEKAFSKLESMFLYKLNNMEKIYNANIQTQSLDQPKLGFFRKLKIIKIKLCGQLKNVFLFSMVEFLAELETIEVSECNSLEGIVAVDSYNVPDIKFPELRSLTLQSLSEFIGFYTEERVQNREPRELFDKKVVVSKLERLELSSIQIGKIWSDQPYPNLVHLDVNGCWNLEYLLSFSMAKNLVNLQSLFVSECEKMRGIFPQGEGIDAKMKDRIFPKLKSIKLSSMKGLREILNSNVPSDSFEKLDNLIIEECKRLDSVFPSDTAGRFGSKCKLRVTNCKSMTKIFDLGDLKRDAGGVINLQSVHLEALPKLEHIWKWNKDRGGIIRLENLQKTWVLECPRLENIFPLSAAGSLTNLEYLVVWDCGGLKEIVAEGEGPNKLKFPKLTTIKFSKLPKLQSFYRGARTLSWPALNDLSVEQCDKLEPFRKETADAQRKPVLFPEEVIYKLKSIQIEPRDTKSSRGYMGNNRMDNLEELHLSRLMDTEILYSFLHSNPNLKSLWLNECSFKELVPGRRPATENLGVVPKLKSLKLINFPSLETIGFERDIVLQRIECLILNECPKLVTIVPSSVSFTHLTNLEVVNCNGLINLMAPSTVKSLVQLTTMKIIKCESLKEIVSEQRNEEENAVEIVFRQLKALELVNLKSLINFCSSKSCKFEFPSLETLVVSACPSMQKFSDEVKSTPSLRKIYAVHREEDQRWYWEGDLNATIQKMFKHKIYFEGMDELAVWDHLQLQQVWQSEVGPKDNWFYSLKTLKLENCEIQPYAIPSNVLPYLMSLNDLQVRNCDNVEVIFDMNDTEIKGTAFLLKTLTLESLPNLTHIWDKNCQGVLSFQNLQAILVIFCEKLKTLFPAVLAKNLKKLEKLDISYCDELLEIVGKEEAAATETAEKFLFPRLTSLELMRLPQLIYFYPDRFTLECPELNLLTVFDCDKLELFQSQQVIPEGQAQGGTSIYRQPLFSDQKAFSNLEELTLNWKHTSVLKFGQFTEVLQLNQLNLCFDDDINEKSTLPFEFLEKARNLEFIAVSNSRGLKEIFPSQSPKIGENEMLEHLKTLHLFQLFELQSIGIEYLSNKICGKLHILIVSSCPLLKTLVQSAVSFSNLKKLVIRECHGLECLFTSSTAKMLTHLEVMNIKKCESMKEIVAKEEAETTSQEIKFERLEKIVLDSLSSLECFYSGNDTLQLPSLIQVVTCQCPNMKVFSQGSIHAESFRGIQVSSDSNDDLVFHQDLNATAKWMFRQQGQIDGDRSYGKRPVEEGSSLS